MFLQVSNVVVTPSGGVHPCRHLPSVHENFVASQTHSVWYCWHSKVTPASHCCRRLAQPTGAVGNWRLELKLACPFEIKGVDVRKHLLRNWRHEIKRLAVHLLTVLARRRALVSSSLQI